MHEAEAGASTGEVSAAVLLEVGVDSVLLGHSGRRGYFNETNRALQAKVVRALDAGLAPVVCVGETQEEHESGETERRLRHLVQEGLARVGRARLAT
jgi:triosephosphate isomerase